MMKMTLVALCWVIAAASTAMGDPFGRIETQFGEPSFAFYSGGTNSLVSPRNPIDWRKRTDIEAVYVEDGLTVEEMRYICQIPNLKFLHLGHSPEVAELRPGALDELVHAKKLEMLIMFVDTLAKNDLKVFQKKIPLRALQVHIGPSWNKVGMTPEQKVPVMDDEIGYHIADLENLDSLNIVSSSTLTNAFLKRLSKCKKLELLIIHSSKFDDESLKIIGSMNLRELNIELPKTRSLTFHGLRDSPIRQLRVLDSDRKGGLSFVLNEQAFASLLAMKNLESIGNIEDWSLEGPNAEARMEQLKKHLEANRARNAESASKR